MNFARLLLIACAVLWHVLTGSPVYGADQAAPSEYAVKAAFIFNFAKFTEWPAAASGAPHGQIVLCAFAGEAYRAALAAIDGNLCRDAPFASDAGCARTRSSHAT